MTGRLSNESIKSFILKRIIKEYRKFIVGANNSLMKDSFRVSNRFNLFNFDAGLSIPKEFDIFKNQIANLFAPRKGDLSDSDKNLESIRDDYIYDMLDSTYAAFFLKDIASGDAFKNKNKINKNDYFTIVHEPELTGDSNYLDTKFSVKSLIKTATVQAINSVPDTTSDGDKIKDKKTLSIQYQSGPVETSTNSDLNKTPNSIPSRLKPSLGAIVIKKPGLGLPAKNSEHLNIFFNAISTLEMSRCTPYIDVAFVTKTESNLPNNINNVTFMRFVKEEGKDNKLVLDENIGLKTAKPFAFDSIFGVNDYSIDNSPDISLMDIFTSPQTMANANVNKDIRHSKGIYSNEVLEPIAPLLSLSDLSIDISGMGIALFSSKVGSMTLKLHDRSRLADISHLVSPKSFGTTKVIIEFGWSHPEGNIANDNIIGQFLNSMRDRSVYTVKSSNFSFSESNIVNIGLSLACYGQQQALNVSCAAGEQVPLNVFKEGIRSMLSAFTEDNISKQKDLDKLRIKEVRNIMKVHLRNATSNTKLISFKLYSKIVEKYEQFRKVDNSGTRDKLKEAFIAAGVSDELDTMPTATQLENIKKIQKDNFNSLMHKKILGLVNNEESESDFKGARYRANFLNKSSIAEALESSSLINAHDEILNKYLPAGETYISLGKILMSFIGHPLAMSGMFDEGHMIFYPLNIHAGAACIHTTASMPIEYSLLQNVITDKMSETSNLSITGFFNLIEKKIIRDRGISAYGVSGLIRENQAEIEAMKNNKEIKAAKTNVQNLRKQKERAISELFEELQTELAEFKADDTKTEEDVNQKRASNESKLNTKKKTLNAETESLTSADKDKIKQHEDNIKAKKEELKSKVKEAMANIYKKAGGGLRDSKFIRPNLTLYMESLNQRDPSETVSGSPYNLKSIFDGSYLDTLKNQIAGSGFEKHSGIEKTICRIHIYDENAGSNPRKQLLQSILTENAISRLVKDNKKISAAALMKEYGLNSSAKIKNFVKNSYPAITYGANNSTAQGISITSNVSDQVSQVIQISTYARRNNPQDSSSVVNDFEEVTVVPASVNLRTMGNPFISRGNEIYIDFGTNTTLDNIYTVKSVSHSISNGKFETSVGLIYSGQGDTKSIAGDIRASLENNLK